MTPRQFAKIAISFPGAVEAEHMGHPDFRFSGKIFASLNAADGDLGMVKLTPTQQTAFLETHGSALELAFENVVEAQPKRHKPKSS